MRHDITSRLSSPSIHIDQEGDYNEEEGKEHKSFVGVFQSAVAEPGSVAVTGSSVVVLGGEDEGCEPEVGEDEVQWHIPVSVDAHVRDYERWDPEAEE